MIIGALLKNIMLNFWSIIASCLESIQWAIYIQLPLHYFKYMHAIHSCLGVSICIMNSDQRVYP